MFPPALKRKHLQDFCLLLIWGRGRKRNWPKSYILELQQIFIIHIKQKERTQAQIQEHKEITTHLKLLALKYTKECWNEDSAMFVLQYILLSNTYLSYQFIL